VTHASEPAGRSILTLVASSVFSFTRGDLMNVGYGEDGLTYWALTQRRAEFLHAVGDRTIPDDCLLFFRPSFGRAAGLTSPQFGEFDSILASRAAVYLIESKWDGSLSPL